MYRLHLRPRILILAAIVIASAVGCRSERTASSDDRDAYDEAVASFYTALAAMQVGEDRRAEEKLRRVSELYPDEPAAWANLGLLAMRRNEIDLAAERLERAQELAPEDGRIHFLLGTMEGLRGRPDEAAAHFRRAVELDPENPRAIYALAMQIEEMGEPEARREVRRLVESILEIEPNNLALLVERARLQAVLMDGTALRAGLQELAMATAEAPADVREQLTAAQQAAETNNFEEAQAHIAFLSNVLKQETRYREDLAAVRHPPEQPGELIASFMRLPAPHPEAAPADDSLTFHQEELFAAGPQDGWRWARPVHLSADGLPVVFGAAGVDILLEEGTRLPLPGAETAAAGLIPLDYDYDFQVDLALAGPSGFRLFRQKADSSFEDVSSQLALPGSILESPYSGGWAVDVDLEGDIDLVLASTEGPPTILKNTGDGRFELHRGFDEVSGTSAFVWADFDADGDPDAALLDASGRLFIYHNRRSMGFEHVSEPPNLGTAHALAVADLNADGLVDITALLHDGSIVRLQYETRDGSWLRTDLVTWEDALGSAAPGPGAGDAQAGDRPRLLVADLDNNGALDLIVSSRGRTAVWLGRPDGTHASLPQAIDADVYAASDLTGAGRLDLIGIAGSGRPVRLASQGARTYHSKSIRPMAASTVGDQRINPFGIGGEIEVRSGALFQKQPVTEPVVHFGIGEHLVVDVVRIVWPNGDIQAEFDLLSDETVQARQRLKGSCPWLFTYDGHGMRFVTDFIWRSPLGLRINAVETAGIMTTEDWVKIGGDELVPRKDLSGDPFYDVRITAELWETHFFDHVSLLVVDHPAETEVFVDERFAFPPPDLAVRSFTKSLPVRRAVTHRGEDITELVREEDERYARAFDLGQYQGVAEEHYVEIELDEGIPLDRPIVLLASGWIRPTDSSINVALAQGSHPGPRGLTLEVSDGRGGWRTVTEDLGFPAGKAKTILLNLSNVLSPGGPPIVRLRTNLEIYWDRLAWAEEKSGDDVRMTRLDPDEAVLRYRGFSHVERADDTSPEIPSYEELAGTSPIWRDLAGYYTRFGEVGELLRQIDDRYVIMNAGDELAFRFLAVEEPPEGWRRDFVLIGDGWVKDGDYNTAFSETVLPLPAHGEPDYSRPPGRLEDDPVYRRHSKDWQRYHTRYVHPGRFGSALRF